MAFVVCRYKGHFFIGQSDKPNMQPGQKSLYKQRQGMLLKTPNPLL